MAEFGAPERHPGLFVVDLGGAMIGQVFLKTAKGLSVPAAAGKAELGYLFLPEAWGFGYAAEVCAAALGCNGCGAVVMPAGFVPAAS